MLVLKRRLDEKIVIDPRKCHVDELGLITITVVELKFDHGCSAQTVKLGIEAPRSISVHRGEVQDEIDAGRGRK